MMEETTPRIVHDLVERFTTHHDAYLSSEYNETQVRREFIDPFFKALGWDVDNEQGNAESWKEVVHEDAIKIGGLTKAPDYSFRLGGRRLFFLEAKKPSVNLKEDPAPAYQLRRYAWSAHLPISILTDFEDFIIYDTRILPAITDKASKARVLIIHYTEYADRWDEIVSIFSPDAIRKGAFDKYAEAATKKRGTAEVDDAFLAEIEDWRGELARNFALRNPGLTQRELNVAVQNTIDRIIFLRICEDRGIEDYGRLQALLNGPNTYARLREIFDQADERYNSGLFHFRAERDRPGTPDVLTPRLTIDDKVLKDIFKRLYYPECPYEFSVLPAEILGHVYERFLGSVIRLTEGGHAKVEQKPEVRKAGGVYYTPTYIVDYIVKHTVGALLEGKMPQDVAGVTENWRPAKNRRPLAILDPACGSGSFLLGAYQFLLDWHLEQYTKDLDKWSKGKEPKLFRDYRGVWRLTTTERKRILLANIFGVDIDAQAVEVTKLSLLLKVLEGENAETLQKQFALFHERALPDLGANIKCGNSLIGPDFYEGRQAGLFDEEEMYRVNAFDWNVEFPEIMVGGGFDAVIGNPPYGVVPTKEEQDYCARTLPNSQGFPDSYCRFIEKALNLARTRGSVSFIVPNTFCDLENCSDFRQWIMTSVELARLWQSGWAFSQAVVDTVVFVICNEIPSSQHTVVITVDGREYIRQGSEFLSNDLNKIDYRNSTEARAFLSRLLLASVPFREFAIVKAGVKLYERGKGIPRQTSETMKDRPFTQRGKCPDGWRALYRGENIARYILKPTNEYVNYGKWLAAPREPELFSPVKLLMRRTDDKLRTAMDETEAIAVNSCHVIKLRPLVGQFNARYFLGLLNSRLLQRVFEIQNPQMVRKVFAEIKVIYVERLPIPRLDISNKSHLARHDRMVSLVEAMLELKKRLASATTDHERTLLERKISETDREIDRLVYELYNLSEEEIRLTEEAAKTD